MNNAVLILGESGSGKSTAIRTLPPEETFIVNVIGKNLPFRGSNKKYTKLSPDGKEGNYYISDNVPQIIRIIKLINEKRPEIKYLVIDDAGYILTNEYMAKSLEKGWEKYNALGKSFFDFLNSFSNVRDDLMCFIMMHVEKDANGKTHPKTVGNVIDKHICIEGKFTYCLSTVVNDGNYKFVTNNDNINMCKSPAGMFDHYIDNDLLLVSEKIKEYLNGEII
jgi:ABC-type dipeptide/oligopeptide/nickel transport system ATPase component